MSEILRLKARLSQEKSKYREKELLAEALEASIRSILDPFEEDMLKKDTKEALTLMQQLHITTEEMQQIKKSVYKMEKELGE